MGQREQEESRYNRNLACAAAQAENSGGSRKMAFGNIIAKGFVLSLAAMCAFTVQLAKAEEGAEKKSSGDLADGSSSKGKSKSEKKKKGWNGEWPKAQDGESKDADKTAKQEKAPSEQEAVNQQNGEEPKLSDQDAKKEQKEEKKAEAKANLDPNRPFSPEAIKAYNQGVELQQQGFLNQAIQKYKEALAADERIERAHCNLGLIYIAQRNFSKASDAFKKALVLKPNNPFSLNGMGSVFYSKGKLQDAMERWQKAVEVDPNFFSAYFNMANAWKNEKEMDKALENYVMTIKTNSSMADAYYEIGLILAKQKHPAQAQSMIAKALELSPDGDFAADARKQLSGIEGMMGKDEEKEVQMSIVAPPGKESGSGEESK